VRAEPKIVLRLGARVADFAVHTKGVTARFHAVTGPGEEHGIALIGADGLWSTVRARLGDRRPPRFARHSAWRAMLPTKLLLPEFREPVVSLWLGPDAHLVLYPVRAGHALNIVAVIKDDWQEPGWSGRGAPEQLLARFARWPPLIHNLLALPDRWLKWALFDRLPLHRSDSGPVALLGDAAHPVLPFLAQGAAMAIEDAHVLAERLAAWAEEPEKAVRQYERQRRRRTARVQRAAARNGRVYHLRGIAALLRNRILSARGGFGLLRRYDWLYRWHP
jgi:salicylate hydroxylase